jgi:hypothetical protein
LRLPSQTWFQAFISHNDGKSNKKQASKELEHTRISFVMSSSLTTACVQPVVACHHFLYRAVVVRVFRLPPTLRTELRYIFSNSLKFWFVVHSSSRIELKQIQTMFPSKKKPSYASVPSNEDGMLDDNVDDASEDLENLGGEDGALTGNNGNAIQRRRLGHGNGGFLRCYSTLILTLLGVAAMLAIGFFLGHSSGDNSPEALGGGQKSLPLFPQTKDVDDATVEDIMTQSKSMNTKNKQTVHYDPTGLLQAVKPFDFEMTETQARDVFHPPSFLNQQGADFSSLDLLGYLQRPNIVDNHVVFCSEGDAFVTTIPSKGGSSFPATKLTKTVGNVLDPKLHPSLRYLAYTGTYTGRRDIYLMDLLRPQSAAIRLTYWDSSAGVSGLVGWWGNSLVFRAMSNDVSVPDMRLYVLHLSNLSPSSDDHVSVLQIDPVPLSQAIDASRYGNCWYFVRFSQSSNTIRYVSSFLAFPADCQNFYLSYIMSRAVS